MLKSALNHPKMARLANLLGEEITTARGIMESIWHMTAELAPRGNIGKFTNEEILAALHWKGIHKPITADQLIESLVAVRYLDHHPEYRLVCHDWHQHCDDYVHMRLANETLTFCNGTIPRLRRFAKEKRPEILARYDSRPGPQNTAITFDDFWKVYPRKRHKDRAAVAWRSLNPDTTLAQAIIHAVEAHLAVGMFPTDPKFIAYPHNWLKARAWEDTLEEAPPTEAPGPALEDRDPADYPDDIAVAIGTTPRHA